MIAFPQTPASLLARLAADLTGQDEARWTRLIGLYRPVMVKFAASLGARGDAEDIVQDVFGNLVGVFRRGGYKAGQGSFRAYLATAIRHEVINWRNRERVRGSDRKVPFTGEGPGGVSPEPEPPAVIDAKWRLARREAAREHVLTRTALARRTKEIYAAYVLEERPIGEVAEAFGVSRNVVAQAKSRVEAMIAGFEAQIDGE